MLGTMLRYSALHSSQSLMYLASRSASTGWVWLSWEPDAAVLLSK
jgi:hypothetical protein